MMNSSRLEKDFLKMEDKVIKDIRYKKSIKNLFRLKNENRAI